VVAHGLRSFAAQTARAEDDHGFKSRANHFYFKESARLRRRPLQPRVLAGAGAVGDGAFWSGESWQDAIGIAKVEQHALGNLSGHFLWLQV